MLHSSFRAALCAAAFGAGATGLHAQVTLDLSSEIPPTSMHAQMADFFVAAVAEESGGDVIITAHHGAALGFRGADHFDAVADGALDLATSFGGGWVGIEPVFLVSSMPFLAPSLEENRALYEASVPFYEPAFAANNQVMLFATPWPATGIFANKAVDSPEALAGLRIRSYDTPSTETMRNVGAAPLQITWADTIPQLTTGALDAVMTSADAGVAGKLWEHQSHFTEVNYAMPLQFVHMNRDIHDGLTDDQRAAVQRAAARTVDHAWGVLEARVADNYAALEAEGVTVVTELAPGFIDTLREAAAPALADWVARYPQGQALLDAYAARIDD
jgi:TRAP-type C4-dicarboxylate transport system substrate-binding protein